jgi:hypothetical protein
VAGNSYVQGQSGWFSCRFSCYLAAVRPVVVQDTSFSKVIPTGADILAIDTFEDAVDGVHEVMGNPTKHSQAAMELAAEFIDTRILLLNCLRKP